MESAKTWKPEGKTAIERGINRMNRGIMVAQETVDKAPLPEFRAKAKEAIEDLQALKKAAEKQIPQKLKVATPYEECTLFGCPRCDHMGKHLWEFGIKTPCCPNCGQALDWGE